MTIAIIIGVCIILAILAFLLPRLSRHPQRGVDSTLAAGESAAGTAPGKLGEWLKSPSSIPAKPRTRAPRRGARDARKHPFDRAAGKPRLGTGRSGRRGGGIARVGRRGGDIRPRRDRRCHRCPAGSRGRGRGRRVARRRRVASGPRRPDVGRRTNRHRERLRTRARDPARPGRRRAPRRTGRGDARARHRPHGRPAVPERGEPRSVPCCGGERRRPQGHPRCARVHGRRSSGGLRGGPGALHGDVRGQDAHRRGCLAGDGRVHRRVRRRLVG